MYTSCIKKKSKATKYKKSKLTSRKETNKTMAKTKYGIENNNPRKTTKKIQILRNINMINLTKIQCKLNVCMVQDKPKFRVFWYKLFMIIVTAVNCVSI